MTTQFIEFTQAQKLEWSHKKASENIKFLSKFLNCGKKGGINRNIPRVLLEAAARVAKSVKDRSILSGARICNRDDHYVNSIKVLCVAILNYDLAENLVGRREKGVFTRCNNSLFANFLNMPSRTVDNCIYSLKRAGLYLSFELREKGEKTEDGKQKWKGVHSIKRLNSTLFTMLGLGDMFAKEVVSKKIWVRTKARTVTPTEKSLNEYKKTDDRVREKRNAQRASAQARRDIAELKLLEEKEEIAPSIPRKAEKRPLKDLQAENRTAALIALMAQGMTPDEARAYITDPKP